MASASEKSDTGFLNIAVFCSSRDNIDEAYRQSAVQTGDWLGHTNRHLIFGGTDQGLMNLVADHAYLKGGRVTGVVPAFFLEGEDRPLQGDKYSNCHDLVVCRTMAERKTRMIEMADAFVILPGGLGTFEELFEVLSLKHLRQVDAPIWLINVGDFFRPFFSLLDHFIETKVASERLKSHFQIFPSVEAMIQDIDSAG